MLSDDNGKHPSGSGLRPQSELPFALVFSSTSDMMALIHVEADEVLRVQAVNRSYLETVRKAGFDLNVDALAGKTLPEVFQMFGFGEEVARTTLERYLQVVRTRKELRYEEITPTPAGPHYGEVELTPIVDADGACVLILYSSRDVTERRRLEQASRESERRLRLVIEAASEGLWEWNMVTNEIFWSDRTFEILGQRREEFGGDLPFVVTLLHPEDKAVFENALKLHLEEGLPYDHDVRLRRRDGTYGVFRTRGKVSRDESGKPVHMVGSVGEVTEARRQARLLEQTEMVARIGGWELDCLSKELHWTAETYRIHDTSPEEYRPELSTAIKFYPETWARVLRAAYELAMEQGANWDLELELLTLKGRKIAARMTGCAEREGGRTTRLYGAIQDITERKLAAAALQNAEQQNTALINSIQSVFWEADATTFEFTFVSPQAVTLLGFPVTDWFRPGFWKEQIHEDDREWAVAFCVNQTRECLHHDFEYRMIAADGRVKWVRDIVTVTAENGKPKLLRGLMVDITEKRTAEAALRESEERYRLLVETSTDVVCEVSGDGRYLYVSPTFKTVFGFEPKELIGISALEMVHPDDLPEVAPKFQQDEATVTFRHRHKDGTWRWLEATGKGFRHSTGEKHGVLVGRDVTARKLAEERQTRLELQLRQSQKMEAIGTLAGGIAHDFNNILGAILAFTDLARMDAGENRLVRDHLDQVHKAGTRARDLVNQILTFSRQQRQERRAILLQPVIQEVYKLLRSTLPASIELAADIRPDAGVVLADPTQIHQVLLNLCTNSAHAMNQRPGRLEIRLAPFMVGEQQIQRAPELRPGPYVRLSVSDSGHGMDDQTIKRIFDPFFTTKGPGEGTGLGLAVVHGIVQDHDGVVEVVSEPERGTTIHVLLPVHASEAPEVPAGRLKLPLGSGERILFVDDEVPLCNAVAKVLQKLNYKVTTQLSPAEALRQFLAQPGDFDLVITDLSMPGLNGIELATQILALRPEIPVILTTGFSGTWTPEKVRAMGIRAMVMKPIAPAELADVMSRLLKFAPAVEKR